MEPRRCRPIRRKHVSSFISAPSLRLHVTLFRYGSHPFYLEHRWVPSTNSFQSHGVFLSRCVLSFLPSLLSFPDRVESCPALRGRTSSSPRRRPRTSLWFSTVSSVGRSICTSSQAQTRRASLNNTGKWSVCPPGRQIGALASIFAGGAMRAFPRRKSRWMPCVRRISPSKVRSFTEKSFRKRFYLLGLFVLTSWHVVRAVMWNDLELYHDYRDFTVDPVTFPANEMRDFIRNLVSLLFDSRSVWC